MTARQWFAWIAAAGISLWLLCGCATEAMRNGVGQARYELTQAIQKPAEASSRLVRADGVLGTWQTCYGVPTRLIDDNSLQPVIYEMQHDVILPGVIGSVGGSWLTLLFGCGGTGTIFLGLLIQYLRERGRRRETEEGAGDIIQAVEEIPNDVLKREVKESVRKKQASRTALGALVKKATNA